MGRRGFCPAGERRAAVDRDGGSAVERLINWMGGSPGNSLLSGTEWEEDLYRAITAAREGRLPPEPAGKADETQTSDRLGQRLYERALGSPEGVAVVALTSGADEALLRLLTAFTEPGDAVLTERLAPRPALQLFRRMAVRTVTVPGDESGMDPEALLAALAREKPAFVYASPVCPDPSGRRWDDERRRALALLCAWAGVPLVRDDRQLALAESPGSFEAEREAGVRLYSVGQVPPGLFPGLRLGWIAALGSGEPGGTHRRFDGPDTGRAARRLRAAVHGAALRWLDDPRSHGHWEAFRRRCRDRLRLFLRTLAAADLAGCGWIEPDGGMHVWIRLPEGLEGEAMLRTAWRKGLLFQPGSGFFAAQPERNAIRVTPVHTPEPQITEGVRRLRESAAELLGRWSAW